MIDVFKAGCKGWKIALTLAAMPAILLGCAGPVAGGPSPTAALMETRSSAATAAPSAVRLKTVTLYPADRYFSIDGRPALVFSHNIAGYQQAHYRTLLDWTKHGGSTFVRVQIDSLGMGYTSAGAMDARSIALWDRVLDEAEARGLYVLPAFGVWYQWNAGAGYSTWLQNPLNSANGGPAASPADLFREGSEAQTLWLAWMRALVERWQDKPNILGWEIFSEVNLVSGATEPAAIDFVNLAAETIRAADRGGRPITASLAETGTWPTFYRDASIDFVNVHPYPPSGQLDRTIITMVREALARYGRPVLIGESGLSAATPDSADGRLTVADNARRGIQHAIWAGMVSGAMNGRALWWEDGYGVYFPELEMNWMAEYGTEERAAADFIADLDFSGFAPVTASATREIWGAALGSEDTVMGWYRDASSEPPDWNLSPVLRGQSVTLTIPGSAAAWAVDFYDTQTGTDISGSIQVTAANGTVTVPLPDFVDAIAFRMRAKD